MPTSYLQHRISIGNNSSFKDKPIKHNLKNNEINLTFCFKNKMVLILITLLVGVYINECHILINKSHFKSKRLRINVQYYNSDKSSVTENVYEKVLQAKSNKINYSAYGNKNNTLKLLQLNKGSSNFENKINDVQNIINKYKPDIMCLSEANIKKSYKQNILSSFPEYNIELNSMSNNIDISRNAIIINNKIAYSRRYDLENDFTCTIWIEIYIPNCKPILLMGGYRQWKLLKIMNVSKSGSNNQQFNRYKNIIEMWEKAMYENKETIVLMDDNIDSNPNSSHNKSYNLKKIYDILQSLINKHDVTQHNNKMTRFATHQPPSCIDHIYSNCPNKISNVKTHSNATSDHSIITAQYTSKHQIYHPKFIKIRKHSLINKYNLTSYINSSDLLNSIFNYSDPEIITNIIQLELNTIINSIAPSKIIQYKKDYVPYHNNEIRNNLKESEQLLNKAIKNYDQNDWRNFRNYRNKLSKDIDNEKNKYIQNKFRDKDKQWQFLKQFNNNNKQQIPDNISHDNKQITSPKSIAKIANDFFIEKVKKNKK